MSKLDDFSKAYDILVSYNGSNPYLLTVKRDVVCHNHKLNDFEIQYILANYNVEPRIINKITKIPSWFGDKKQKEWGLDFSPKVLKIITYLGETSTAYCCFAQYRKSVEPQMMFIPKNAVINNFLVDDYMNIDVDFDKYDKLSTKKDPNRKLMLHQKEAVQFLLGRKHCILADSMGLGKTTSLAVASLEGGFESILIICPASLKTNWRNELLWYADESEITIIDSVTDKTKSELEKMLGYKEGESGKKREELLEEANSLGKWRDNKFVIINYDILDQFYKITHARRADAIQEAFMQSPMLQYIYNKKSCIIIDEAHRLSNSTSIRYKVIKDLIKKGKPDSLYLSTGTPITNNPKNLFCLLQLLNDPIKDDWNYYMNRYCGARKFVHPKDKEKRNFISTRYIMDRNKKDWYELTPDEKMELQNIINRSCRMMTVADGATNLDELKERISHIYLRRIKEDLGKMPQKYVYEMFYDLSMDEEVEYDRLWKEYETQKLSENPDKELNKELLEGGIYRRYLSKQMVPHTEQLCDNILSKGEKVIIFCCYDDELYTLADYYKDSCVVYNGKMSIKQKDAAVEKFMNDKSTNVFIGNIIAAGVGINLTNACYVVFNNISFVPSDNEQGCDRVFRIGQKKDCHIYYQMFRNTQYERMWDTVLRKSCIINAVIKKEDEK